MVWERKGVSVVMRLAVPRRVEGKFGSLPQEEFGNVWALNRLVELSFIANKAGGGSELSVVCLNQWKKIVRKVCSPSAPIALRQEPRMGALLRELQRFIKDPSAAAGSVTLARNWISGLVVKGEKRREKEATSAWRGWKLKVGRAGGGEGMLFQFVKRTQEDPELATKCLGKWSKAADDVVQADFATWNALWQRLHGVATAPWREKEGWEEGEEGGMERITGEMVGKAAKTFKVKTALGIDAISPCHYSWLSDVLLERVAGPHMELEEAGMWPAQLTEAIVHLIPKLAGGRKPVGLLPSLVRAWGRAGEPAIVKWRRANQRDYDWMIEGRGAERSVWTQAILDEAA